MLALVVLVPFTGAGRDVEALIADVDQRVTDAGQLPLTAGSTWTEPGL
jgi:hypothetical protein